MFKIDTASNSITSLTIRTFGEIGFKERTNLQEWIAKEPSCLGEELLVIQKEFSGFLELEDVYHRWISRVWADRCNESLFSGPSKSIAGHDSA
jgi:hypothetical protein